MNEDAFAAALKCVWQLVCACVCVCIGGAAAFTPRTSSSSPPSSLNNTSIRAKLPGVAVEQVEFATLDLKQTIVVSLFLFCFVFLFV